MSSTADASTPEEHKPATEHEHEKAGINNTRDDHHELTDNGVTTNAADDAAHEATSETTTTTSTAPKTTQLFDKQLQSIVKARAVAGDLDLMVHYDIGSLVRNICLEDGASKYVRAL
jgi:hypothetical protein